MRVVKFTSKASLSWLTVFKSGAATDGVWLSKGVLGVPRAVGICFIKKKKTK